MSQVWLPSRRMSELHQRIAGVFQKAPFIADLGIELADSGEGWVETRLKLAGRLLQQHGFAHAGVVSTLADHTAGAAASTVIDAGQSVLTADYTIHLLRPAKSEYLRSRGEVVKPGRKLIVSRADVWADDAHCATYVSTLAVVDQPI